MFVYPGHSEQSVDGCAARLYYSTGRKKTLAQLICLPLVVQLNLSLFPFSWLDHDIGICEVPTPVSIVSSGSRIL